MHIRGSQSRAILSPRGHVATSGDAFVWHMAEGMLPTSNGQRLEVPFHILQRTGQLPRQKATRLQMSVVLRLHCLALNSHNSRLCVTPRGRPAAEMGDAAGPGEIECVVRRRAVPRQAGCTGALGSLYIQLDSQIVLHRSESPESFGVPLRAPMCQAPHPTLRSRGYTEKTGLSF